MITNTIPTLLEKGYTHWDDANVLSKLALELNDRNRLYYATMFADRALELVPHICTDAYLAKFFLLLRNLQSTEQKVIDTIRDTLEKGYQWTKSGAIRVWSAMLVEDEETAKVWMDEAQADDSLGARIAIASMLSWWRGREDEGYDAFLSAAQTYPADTSADWGEYCSFMLSHKNRGKDVDIEYDIIPRLTTLQQAHPNSIKFCRTLIRSYMVLDNATQAIHECLRALRSFPDDETLMFTLAGLYEKANDDTQALLWYHRAIGAKPSYIGARLCAAGIYERQQNIALAEYLMREIPLANPDVGYGKIELAYFLFRHGQEEEATTIFAKAWDTLYHRAKGRVEQHAIGKQLLERSRISSPTKS